MTFNKKAVIGSISVSLGAAIVLFAASPTIAQSFNLDFGEGGSSTARIVQLVVLLTVISLAPSILVMVTSFARIVIVLSLLRTALGTQGAPPNSVMVSLALFMTFFIMQPTLETAYDQGVAPLIEEQITEEQALDRTMAPVKGFMLRHVREKDIDLFRQMANVGNIENQADTPTSIGTRIYDFRTQTRVRDRVSDFHTISNYRYGGRICPHVDGYDDVTPRNDIFAVQAHIFCFGRRLVFGCWKLGSKLRRIIATLF